MGLLTALRKRSDKNVEVAVEEVVERVELPSGPQLAVLIPDIAGISSFRLRILPTAAAAEEHIASLRADVRQGTHAFWALHDKPIVNDTMHVESLVLIRADTGSDLVYVVSFLDLESALSFTRFEVRRGLHLGNVMIYWAAFATVREELSGVSIRPIVAPRTAPSLSAAVDLAPAPQATAAVADPVVAPEPEVIAPEPQRETHAEAEAREAVERYLRRAEERAPEPVIEDTVTTIEPPVIERPAIDELVSRAEALVAPAPAVEEPVEFEDDFADEEPLWPTSAGTVIEPAPAAEPIAFEEPTTVAEPVVIDEPGDDEPLWPTPAATVIEHDPIAEPVAFEEPTTVAEPILIDEPEGDEPLWPKPAAVVEPAPVAQPIAYEAPTVVAEPEPYAEEEAYSEPVEFEEQLSQVEPVDFNDAPTVFRHSLSDSLLATGVADGLLVEPEVEERYERKATELRAYVGEEENDDDAPVVENELSEIAAIAQRLIAGPEVVESVPGDEETEIDGRVTARFTGDPTATLPEVEKFDQFDIAYEVQRFLENRKRLSDTKDGPFSGFQSPPGRF